MRNSIRAAVLLFAVCPVLAASPPQTLHYQGVLRDADDDPLDGDYEMVFRFFDAESLGNEILIDEHLAAGTGAVTVTGGLFAVALGGGSVADGSGPGNYTSLGQVFRDHASVFVEVTIGSETLMPRVEIAAGAFALNAAHLEGASLLDVQTEIDGDVAAHAGLSDAHHWPYTDADADARIGAHAAVANAHHDRYTDQEARAAARTPDAQAPRNPKQVGMLRWYESLAPQPVRLTAPTSHSRAIAFDGESIWLAYVAEGGPVDTFSLVAVRTTNATPGAGGQNLYVSGAAADRVAGCIVHDGKHLWVSVVDGRGRGVDVIKLKENDSGPLQQLGPSYASTFGCALDGEHLWLRSNEGAQELVRVRTSDGSVSMFSAGGSGAHGGMAFDGKYLWVVNNEGTSAIASLSKIRPADGALLTTVDLRPGLTHMDPRGIVFDGRYLWVAFYGTGMTTLTRVDPSDPSWTGQTTLDVGYRSFDLAFDGIYLWVTHPLDDRVTKIQASDGKPIAAFSVTAPHRIAFDGANVWVTQFACGSSPPVAELGACVPSVDVASKL